VGSSRFPLSLAPQHFDEGSMLAFPTFTSSFVASGATGTVVDFTFAQFEYTLTPDALPSFTVTCAGRASGPDGRDHDDRRRNLGRTHTHHRGHAR
jgi:hypothetical protein